MVPGASRISVNVCGKNEQTNESVMVVSLVVSILCFALSPFFKVNINI